MESKNITIGFDAAKLDALEFVLRKQRSSVQRRMESSELPWLPICTMTPLSFAALLKYSSSHRVRTSGFWT